MSTASVIVVIVVILGVLVSYTFVHQTVQTKREQRLRLLTALKSRSRTFKFMLNGFPDGFLSKELKLLVQRSLADVSEQLSKLEPKDPQYLQDLQLVNTQMMETQRQTSRPESPMLENPQQLKDVRAALEELNKYIYKLEAKQTLPRNQAAAMKNQIRTLALQLTVDGHCLNGKQARQAGKVKLALHYYDLANSLIKREAKTEALKPRLIKIQQMLEQLNQRMQEEQDLSPLSEQEQAEAEDVENQWDKFSSSKEEVWKKKNIYD